MQRSWILLLAAGLLVGCPEVEADDDDAGDDDSAAGDDDTTEPDFTDYLYAHTSSTLYEVSPFAPYTVTSLGEFVGAPGNGITDIALDLDGKMYVCGFDDVFQVDPDTLELTWLATFGGGTLNALTALSDGTLLAGTGSTIYRVEPATGTVTEYGTAPGWTFAGDMVGLPDGLLYMLMAAGQPTDPTSLVVFDPADGQATEVGPTGHGAMYGVGYAEDVIFGFNEGGQILEVDQQTGGATVLDTPGYAFWGAATNPYRGD